VNRPLALFAVLAASLFVAGTAALAYRASTPGGTVVQVSIMNYRFTPGDLTVRAGTTVRWVNMDMVGHTVSFGTHEDPTGIESPLLGHMGSFSHTFSEPGPTVYHCDPHPYMTGSVLVTP
jgi:plastocyanin